MKKSISLVCLLVCAVVNLLNAENVSKHVITHEDVWLMNRIAGAVPSPDGKSVIIAVTLPAYDAKDQVMDFWIKSLASDLPAERLTNTKHAKSLPVWSPDSTQIAYSMKNSATSVSQIHVLTLADKKDVQFTHLYLGASSPKWSPSGSKLLFVSPTYPGCLTEEDNKAADKEHKGRKYNVRSYEQFPPRFWMEWLDDKRLHPFVQDVKVGSKAVDLLAGSDFSKNPGFSGSHEGEDQKLECLWTPEGDAILFVASINAQDAARSYVPVHIFKLKLTKGEPEMLTHGTTSYDGLTFSKDGKSLLSLSHADVPNEVYDLTRLVKFNWPNLDQVTSLTESLDRSVSSYALTENKIYFTYEYAGLEKLYSVGLNGGEIKQESSFSTGSVVGIRSAGDVLVGAWDSVTSPAEIYLLSSKEPKQLTQFNTGRAQTIDWLPAEHFWFTAKDGLKIHSMIIKPPHFDPTKKYPLFVVIHGGAASMWKDQFVLRWNYHLLAAPGYVVLLTDYKGSTGYGEAFARAIKSDPLKGPADEINEAADQAIARYSYIDGTRQAAGGASYGGHLSNWLEATTTRYKAIISHAGEMDLVMQWGTSDGIYGREVNSGSPVWGSSTIWHDQSPVMQGGNHDKGTGFVTPILITVGEKDFRVPINNALMNFATEQRLGVPSKLLVFPDAGHWVLKGEDSRYWYNEVQAWLAKYLK
jgi:dipeptidyl aminopeptidase/acylaminoacyl peptidase